MSLVGRSDYKQTSIGLVPIDWSATTLGNEVESIIGGGTPSKDVEAYWGGDIPWASVKDFVGSRLSKTQDYITPQAIDASATNLIPAGTLITPTRMALGRVAIFDCDVAINQDLKAIFPKPSLLRDFLFYWFQENADRIEAAGIGSTVKGIRLEVLREFGLALPPIPEQQKIAAILTAVDDKLDVIARQIEATQTLKRGLMQTLFSRGVGTQNADGLWVPHAEFKDSELGEIPAEWAVERIDAIASINPTRTKIDDESLDVTFLGMADISEDGKLIRQHTKKYAEVSKGFTSFVDNDVLVAKITPCFENGKGALVDGLANGIGFGSTEFHVIRADSKILDVRFIHAHTRTRKFRLLGERNMVGSAGQKRVPTEFIKSFLIAVPSLSEQQKIADILDAFDAKAENLIAKHTHYQTLKRGLMQKLLTGEWRVSVDGSASDS